MLSISEAYDNRMIIYYTPPTHYISTYLDICFYTSTCTIILLLSMLYRETFVKHTPQNVLTYAYFLIIPLLFTAYFLIIPLNPLLSFILLLARAHVLPIHKTLCRGAFVLFAARPAKSNYFHYFAFLLCDILSFNSAECIKTPKFRAF